MKKKYTYLDLKNWKRREQFEFFKSYDNPFFNICSDVDVTQLYKFTKENSLSFFIASLYLSIKAANAIEEFRYRIHEDKIVIYEKIHAGSTVLNNDETFSFCYFKYQTDFQNFNEHVQQVLEKNAEDKGELDPMDNDDSMIHYSVIPWIHFSSFSHPRKGHNNDSVPKIVFGKFSEKEGNLQMPVSVEVHHSLMDGLHLGKYFNHFQELLNDPEKNLNMT